jgi:hypothetical protein
LSDNILAKHFANPGLGVELFWVRVGRIAAVVIHDGSE